MTEEKKKREIRSYITHHFSAIASYQRCTGYEECYPMERM